MDVLATGDAAGEVAALTWDQVDFKTGHIHLPNRDIDMGTRMQRLLGEVWDRQKPLNDRRCLWPPPRGIPLTFPGFQLFPVPP